MALVDRYFDRMGVYCQYAQLQDAKGNKAESEKYYYIFRMGSIFSMKDGIPNPSTCSTMA